MTFVAGGVANPPMIVRDGVEIQDWLEPWQIECDECGERIGYHEPGWVPTDDGDFCRSCLAYRKRGTAQMRLL